MTSKKESAGGCETTTAEITKAVVIISFRNRFKASFVRYAGALATYFRGLA